MERGRSMCCDGFCTILGSFQTVFLLNTFSPLFACTDVMFNVLQTEHADIMTCLNIVRDFEEELNRKGFIQCVDCQRKCRPTKNKITEEDSCKNCETVGFTLVWDKTVNAVGLPPRPRKKTHEENVYIQQQYKILNYSVIDNLAGHINARFSSLVNLEFFELLNPRKFDLFSSTNKFPEHLMILLEKLYPGVFDLQGLKNELTVFYRTTIFKGKSPAKLLEFLKRENLDTSFKEVYRLAELICTIPATTASVERSFSALKRIHTVEP